MPVKETGLINSNSADIEALKKTKIMKLVYQKKYEPEIRIF